MEHVMGSAIDCFSKNYAVTELITKSHQMVTLDECRGIVQMTLEIFAVQILKLCVSKTPI